MAHDYEKTGFRTGNPKILYFLAGMVPTQDEREDSKQYGRVQYRNRKFVGAGHTREACDFVAGHVPPLYADAPRAVAREEGLVPTAASVAFVPQAVPTAPPAQPGVQQKGRRGRAPVPAQVPAVTSDWGKQ